MKKRKQKVGVKINQSKKQREKEAETWRTLGCVLYRLLSVYVLC